MAKRYELYYTSDRVDLKSNICFKGGEITWQNPYSNYTSTQINWNS